MEGQWDSDGEVGPGVSRRKRSGAGHFSLPRAAGMGGSTHLTLHLHFFPVAVA